MTTQGHPRTRFARAISARNVILAELAAGELQPMLLEDALSLVRLYGDNGDPKYELAVRKWMARWLVEEKPGLEDIALTACSCVERRGL